MGMKVSNTNLLTQISPTSSATQALFPASNLRSPQRPLLVWKSLTSGSGFFIFDLGSIPSANAAGWLLIATNMNTNLFSITRDAGATWGAGPNVTTAHTVVENPITGRRNYGVWYKTFPYRHIGLTFSGVGGSIQDGQSAWQCGGVWFGPCLDVPNTLLAQFTVGPISPASTVDADTGQFEDHQRRGPSRALWTMQRRVSLAPGVVGVSDDLAKWQVVDRLWGGNPAAVMLDHRDSTKAWIMRNLGDLQFARDPSRRAQSSMTLREVLGP